MRYLDSLTDFFKSPRWMMNLLYGAVCTLIPIVGPMVLHGWLIGGFWGRKDSDPASFPDFDFNRFTKYLTRGLWPVLVNLVFGLVLAFVIMFFELLVFLMVAGTGGSHHGGHGAPGLLSILAMLVLFVAYLALVVAYIIILKPFTLRAELTQNFSASFDLRFALRFIQLTWIECLVSSFFLMAAGLVLAAAGMLALCIGIYFINGPLYYMMVHLNKQVYQIYLARGGEPVAISPTLCDDPPPLPL